MLTPRLLLQRLRVLQDGPVKDLMFTAMQNLEDWLEQSSSWKHQTL